MGYDNSNSGALFPNDNKRGDTDRDHNGKMEITCPHCNKAGNHWISAWENVSRAGKPYMSVKFQPMEDRPSGGSEPGNRGQNPDGTTKPPPRSTAPADVDPADIDPDDIPF